MNRLLKSAQAMVLMAGLLGLSLGACAGQFKDFGDYQVHYSIIPTSLLNPQVARQYDLVRSKARGIVNISILREQDDGELKPVNGQVQGQVANDIQQQRTLGFRRVTEGQAVYFIAEFQFSEGELLTFNITANTPDAERDMALRVTQTLFNRVD